MSRSVPPPIAVMNATVNTPTTSMCLLRASMNPEKAPTRMARTSISLIRDMLDSARSALRLEQHDQRAGAAVGRARLAEGDDFVFLYEPVAHLVLQDRLLVD